MTVARFAAGRGNSEKTVRSVGTGDNGAITSHRSDTQGEREARVVRVVKGSSLFFFFLLLVRGADFWKTTTTHTMTDIFLFLLTSDCVSEGRKVEHSVG